MGRRERDDELEAWRNEARANDGQRTREPVSVARSLPGAPDDDEAPGRDVPCRGCRTPVTMTAIGAWFGKMAALMAAERGFAPLMIHEVMLCGSCSRAQERRRAADFEYFRQQFIERLRAVKAAGHLDAADRTWLEANDCKGTIEALEAGWARSSEKGGRGKGSRMDDGAGFGSGR